MNVKTGNLSSERIKELEKLLDHLSIWFNDFTLLDLALTHSSFTFENKLDNSQNNERLEFLGDAVLKLIASEYLFNRFPDYSEGDMTKIRAVLVSDPTLAKISKDIDLGSYLKIGYHEEQAGGRKRRSIIACAFEAFLGAYYLDSKYKLVYDFLTNLFKDIVENIDQSEIKSNAKAVLQEYTQSHNLGLPEYIITNEEGPAHKKTFTTIVKIHDKIFGTGQGKTKKEAHQEAALIALQNIDKEEL